MAANIFISYCQKDKEWLTLLGNHLVPLQEDGWTNEAWDDRQIRAGDEKGWEEQLLPKLKAADVVILLLTPNFAGSKYCRETELPIAIDRKRAGQALVYFVHVRRYSFGEALRAYPILPSLTLSIAKADDRDGEFTKIVDTIREDLKKRQRAPSRAAGAQALGMTGELLGHLCNRGSQEDKVRDLWKETRAQSRRPMVLLLNGPEDEGHLEFHRRLSFDHLPRITKYEGRDVRPFRYLDRVSDANDRTFLGRMAAAVDLDSRETEKEIADGLPAGLTFLSVKFAGDRWRVPKPGIIARVFRLKPADDEPGEEFRKLQAFLDYLNRWPDVPAQSTLCVGISIGWLKAGPENEELKTLFPEAQYPNLRLRILPTLEPLEKLHADEWLELPAVRNAYDYQKSSACARRNIAAIFAQRRAVPMGVLAPQLVKCLEEFE